ncbi:MAG: RIP metalloprotease RseP [Gammaproteobacteria bacterium HGW-Gammaproteobacteria-8]|nr:MAG: RIP metalloprotease RseP [Gammaproteobacteria bacterium HGW-Gammaproteobacteria-8]
MTEFLGSIFWLAVALGLLVTFHEFGHYWVARRNGVRVLRFSVGFGRPLMRRTSRDGVEFVIAAIPLGGYVKMLDDREAEVAPQDRHAAFNRQSIGARAAIVVAGPAFNLIFAVAAFWAMFMIGIPETRPVLGSVDGLAAEAGLRPDDLIVEVDGDRIKTWTHAVLALMPAALDRRAVTIAVEDLDGVRRETRIALDRLGPEFSEERLLQALGLRPWRVDLPPVIGEVTAGSAAEGAGIRPGDRILSIGGIEIDGWVSLAERIPELAAETARLRLVVERDGRRLELELVPDQLDGRAVIGVRPPPPGPEAQAGFDRTFTVLRHGPIEALGTAVGETWRLTAATFGMLGRMVTGSASLSNLSGPVTIAQMANQSASLGLTRFLFFLGLISLSLAIINLLPIPVLDGGQLLYLLIEWIKGSPVSEQGQNLGQGVGLLMILALMSLAVFNDILRLAQ